jgi:hypothetical protein
MDTRSLLDPVQVQLQRRFISLQIARQAPYPPRILHTIAGFCDAAHFQWLGCRQVISL